MLASLIEMLNVFLPSTQIKLRDPVYDLLKHGVTLDKNVWMIVLDE
jgi:hypothetical protein